MRHAACGTPAHAHMPRAKPTHTRPCAHASRREREVARHVRCHVCSGRPAPFCWCVCARSPTGRPQTLRYAAHSQACKACAMTAHRLLQRLQQRLLPLLPAILRVCAAQLCAYILCLHLRGCVCARARTLVYTCTFKCTCPTTHSHAHTHTHTHTGAQAKLQALQQILCRAVDDSVRVPLSLCALCPTPVARRSPSVSMP